MHNRPLILEIDIKVETILYFSIVNVPFIRSIMNWMTDFGLFYEQSTSSYETLAVSCGLVYY